SDEPAPALPVFAPAGALGPVLALDRPGMLDDAIALREFTPGDRLEVGPFGVRSWLLPHWMPNAGLRLEASGQVLAYTGDSGPSPLLAELARGAGLFLAEATYPWQVEGGSAQYLSSARQAGAVARGAGAGLLAGAALHAQRGGDGGSRGSPVARLDREHVAAAFRSEAFLRVDGAPSGPGFAPLSRFWRAADGWVRTHGNYPWHRAAL